MFNFEEVENILYKQAHKIRCLFPNKYELDELVNEVWVKGSIHKLDNIKYVASRAHWDMIDYLRKVEGRKITKNGKQVNSLSFRTNMHDIKPWSEHSNDMFEYISSREDFTKLIDNNDEIEHLFRCLNKKEIKLLTEFFINEKSLIEVGEIFGVTGPRISNAKKKAIEVIRYMNDIIVKKIEKKKVSNKNIPLVNILPEYVADFEIDNECGVGDEYDESTSYKTNAF
ncbi:MAG: sigma-70 family RNA polymerase sigma factor [Clostridiales bacterium]|nr:sigma-70 family RNA polymerase sigma factor [Clostridiales bacterium]